MVKVNVDKVDQPTVRGDPAETKRGDQSPRLTRRVKTMTLEEWQDGVDEINAQKDAGELDWGQDDYGDSHYGVGRVTPSTGYGDVEVDAQNASGHLGDQEGLCFSKLCQVYGVRVGPNVTSVSGLSKEDLLSLRHSPVELKVYYEYYSDNDERNHVAAVRSDTKTVRLEANYVVRTRNNDGAKTVGITSREQFFNLSNMYAHVAFFADAGDGDDYDDQGEGDGFGADLAGQTVSTPAATIQQRPAAASRAVRGGASQVEQQFHAGQAAQQPSFASTTAAGGARAPSVSAASQAFPGTAAAYSASRGRQEFPAGNGGGAGRFGYEPSRERSVVDGSAESGMANVSGGVKRAKRRVVAGRSTFTPNGFAAKSYTVSSGLMFNNLSEMFQDTVSREYAQEILEAVFDHWRVPRDEPDALKYAEDLVSAFFIATTASNKADYDFEFAIPTADGEVVADFGVLSRVLAEQFGVTRRQFARGMADEFRAYLREPDNTHLLSKLADRAGCDPQMAFLAFDGSTHCSGMTSSQLTFVKMLEGRNLFEDESVMAQGYSQSIMDGVHGRVRSKVQR